MMKLIVLLVTLIACVTASHPGLVSPLIAAPSVVTAQSSQVFARNYNGIVPFAPALLAAPHPVAHAPAFLPHQVVAPYYPSRVVAPFAAPFAPHYHYNPYSPYARPFLY